MKVQLQGQSLRLRVDERELARLLEGGEVSNQTCFGGDDGWAQSLRLHDGELAALWSGPGALQLALPRGEVAALAARLPSREGLAFAWGEGARRLDIRFDVDVRDSVRERGTGRSARPLS